MAEESSFRLKVYKLVERIPEGRVMSYGQIAAICGSPRAARVVGQIAHFGDEDLPWQRVVNKSGGLAGCYPGGRRGQKIALELDGVRVSKDFTVDIDDLMWWPEG